MLGQAAGTETNLNSTLRFKFQMTCGFSPNASGDRRVRKGHSLFPAFCLQSHVLSLRQPDSSAYTFLHNHSESALASRSAVCRRGGAGGLRCRPDKGKSAAFCFVAGRLLQNFWCDSNTVREYCSQTRQPGFD